MANQIYLPNGCRMSTPSVFPHNYEKLRKKLQEKDWRIQYYFHDPDFKEKYPKGKLVIVKGMNSFKVTEERVLTTKDILHNELKNLRNGYNPILKRIVPDRNLDLNSLHPNLPFLVALKLGAENKSVSINMVKEYHYLLTRITKAAKKLDITHIKIYDLRRRNVKMLLETMRLPNDYFNKMRAYLSGIFTELMEYECIEFNPCSAIRKKKVVRKKKELLTDLEYRFVMRYLKKKHYTFYRYSQIFNYSGSRTTEMLRLKKEDVNLKKQEFTVTIKKGNRTTHVKKVILPAVLHLWKELLSEAKDGEVLFSVNLVPGEKEIDPRQIGKRWRRLIQGKQNVKDDKGEILEINCTFYGLKYSFLDSLPPHLAMFMAGHKKPSTTAIYQVNQVARDLEELKGMDINFLKVI